MSTKAKTKTDAKSGKTDGAGKKSDAAKPEASKSEASTTEASKSESPKADAPAAASDGDSGTKNAAASAGGVSYFSSVSSAEYRSGWNDIFSGGEKRPTRQRAKAAAKANNKLPATITLDADDLDPATRDQLEALFRRQAKKKRLNYGKHLRNGQVSWQLCCHISDP